MDASSTKHNLIILNDLRSVPLIAALKLRRNTSDASIVAHESIFKHREYADHTNITWKFVIKFFLVVFFKLYIVKSRNTFLNPDECMGLDSSLFSITEDSSASEVKYPNVYNQVKRLALGSKDLVEYISTYQSSNIFVFNGRTASSYLVSKYCVKHNIKLLYYEYAAHCNGFRLFPVPPHASGNLGELIYVNYRYGVHNLARLKISANQFRCDKLNSIFSKKNKQTPNDKYNIVIFLSSDYEYTSIDFDICDVKWVGNLDFCKSVINKYGTNFSYAIRCHPNSSNDPNWINLYAELNESLRTYKCRIDLYGPDSEIDSHQLILEAELVVTDLSTISLDAILLGKPVDIFGNTDIKYLNSHPWMCEVSGKYMHDTISEPFSLWPNFLVFRFSYIEKISCRLLFFIHRAFTKYEIWRGPSFYKN